MTTTAYRELLQEYVPRPIRNERDFVSVIQLMVDAGQRIYGFDLQGEFFNVNTPKDLDTAEAALGRRQAAFGMAG